MRALALIVLALSLLVVGCGSGASTPSPSPSPSLRTDTVGVAEMYGLRLQGQPTASQIVLPQSFTGTRWGLRSRASQNAGFPLSYHAGQRVVLKSQPIEQTIHASAVTLWTVEKDGTVVGAWLAIADQTPGILGVRSGASQF
jgi:uncharacterized protein YcfL